MTDLEKYLRLCETHKEAWQMALDLNQPADTRREWERKRDQALEEMTRMAWYQGVRAPKTP